MTDHPSALVSVPIEGQSFSSEQDWINRASRVLTAHPEYNNAEHGERKGWRGQHFTALCFDQAGNRMRNGGDFMRATKEQTYPVWWIWPDQIAAMLAAAPAAPQATREEAPAEAGEVECDGCDGDRCVYVGSLCNPAQPPAREDAQPVAESVRSKWISDARDFAERMTSQPAACEIIERLLEIITHPAPAALRAAFDAGVDVGYRDITGRNAPKGFKDRQWPAALAALQAEQGAK